MVNVAITGGAGFIGSNLAVFLKSSGYNVMCIDNLSRSLDNNVRLLSLKDIPLYVADVRDCNKIFELMKDCDIVVHAAALIDVEESLRDPVSYFENNVVGTAAVAKACVDLGVERLVYISSAAVYGDPIKIPVDEDHPTNPLSPYGLSKLLGENIIEFYSKINGLKYVILRLFNVFGPGQAITGYAGVITKFVNCVKCGQRPIIFGDGLQTRDFIHVHDVCCAIEASFKSSHVNEKFNIGSGKGVKILDLAKMIMSLANFDGDPSFASRRSGDIRYSCADISKAKRLLNFYPKLSLEEGLKSVLNDLT
ncbi:MAG: GDP-mannose 4,6-dehydratase [Nitrososphaeria archaeon]|nr:GDP-mannose 4,6-dehydratase [Nitrososphaeria archaeon]